MLVNRQTCRSCANPNLVPVVSLGEQYLASYFANEKFPPIERRIPLEVVRCDTAQSENACGLVQLKHTVPADFMYSSYGYRSGVNEAMASHLQAMARKLEEIAQPRVGDMIIDIGANDATLLKGYQASRSVLKVGFEPSNVAPADSELPENTRYIRSYFSQSLFRKQFPIEKAKIITSIAMFYDLENPGRFIADVAALLHDDGVWCLELSYLPYMLEQNSFDTICHEHLEYYHLAPIEKMLSAHGLKVWDLETNDVNGGSFRLYICKEDSPLAQRYTDAYYRVVRFRQDEFGLGLDLDAPYSKFRKNIESVRTGLSKILGELRASGKKVYGYGASTKGNVTLQYCGITSNEVTAIAERNPAKFGTFTLGTNIPIISEEEMRKAKPDYLLILPWHFLAGFMKREQEFLRAGGKFIVPLPEPRIVDLNSPLPTGPWEKAKR